MTSYTSIIFQNYTIIREHIVEYLYRKLRFLPEITGKDDFKDQLYAECFDIDEEKRMKLVTKDRLEYLDGVTYEVGDEIVVKDTRSPLAFMGMAVKGVLRGINVWTGEIGLSDSIEDDQIHLYPIDDIIRNTE